MTVSGVDTWNPAITDMITSAYRKLGVLAEDETPTAGMFADALEAANSLVKEWDASGIHVWTEEEGVLFLQKGQARYLMGTGSTDNYTDANSWSLLTLTASANIGDTQVVVSITAGPALATGQFYGIVLDANSIFWTSINGAPVVDPLTGLVTVTLTDPLPGNVSTDSYCFAYTTRHVRPLRIPAARRLQYSGMILTPCKMLSRREYMDYPNPLTPGSPTQIFYVPKLVAGEFYCYLCPSDCTSAARYTWLRQLQDFSNPANTADLPQEWVGPLVWNLALELGADFDVSEKRWARIVSMAGEKLEMVRGWDREPEAVEFRMEQDPSAGR